MCLLIRRPAIANTAPLPASWRVLWWAVAAVVLQALVLGTPVRGQTLDADRELCRIRVHNIAGGSVEVSCDGGATYLTVGRVVQHATKMVPGFGASRWAPASSVAAVAIHGVRIKVREARPGEPKSPSGCMMISLVPREFRKIPKGYGGHRPAGSGIYTDIPAGTSVFRNLAPLVGNPVRLEQSGRLVPFPPDYTPRGGDRYVILVTAPPTAPSEIVFENWKGGLVSAIFPNGNTQPVARVVRPVLGVGRYDATTLTGVGRINTNHCGVITISTAPLTGALIPEGQGSERRGGIQIEPANHAQAVSYNAPQVMVVEPLEGHENLEGQPPLFSGYISLAWDPQSPEHSAAVEVKIDNGPWEPMPELIGIMNDAFTAPALNRYFRGRGMDRKVTSGVTHLRILLPRMDRAALARYAAECAVTAGPAMAGGAGAGTPQVVRGVVTLSAALKNVSDPSRISVVTIHVDGRIVAVLNVSPYRHDLDTRRFSNGPHEVEIRAVDSQGAIVAQKKMTVVFDNPAPSS